MRIGSWIPPVSLCLAFLAAACTRDPGQATGPQSPLQTAPPFAWDTAFTVHGLPLSDDSLAERSVVHRGDPRRLDDFFRKCVPGARLRVGFIGGSITEGAHAITPGGRYASRLCGFLGKAFPGTEFLEVNAGIGATTSRFAASRVREDLLVHGPDLIVIEFAVNDDIADTLASEAALEGLLRQCLRRPDVPVIVFQTMNQIGDSVNHRVQARLARHYGLPVVSYRAACWPLVADGLLPWSVLAPDAVHPNDAGHLVCGRLLYAFLKSAHGAATALGRAGAGGAGADELPPPLATDLFEFADLYKPEDSTLTVVENRGWSMVRDSRGRYNLVSRKQGDRLVLRSAARELTLSYLCRKDLGTRLAVALDGMRLDTLANHFPEDWGGGYLRPRQVYRDAERRERVVELVNVDGGLFDLRYILNAR